MTTRVLLRRAVLPHAVLAPLLLAWCASATRDPALPSWVPDATRAAAIAGVVAAWVASGVAVGRPLVGPFTPGDWNRLRSWGRSEADTAWPLVVLVAGALAGAIMYAFLQELWWSPVWFALFWQVVDLAVLGIAFARSGVFRADPAEAERQTAEDERRAAEAEKARLAGDRAAAVAAVRGFHAEHADLIGDEYPPVRLDAELRVRIPDSASPSDAWSAARDLLARLQDVARQERRRRDKELAAALPADPIADRSLDVRTLIRTLEVQTGQMDGEILRQREEGLNTAVLERQLADLRRRKRDAEDELRRLAETPPPAPVPGG